VEGLVSATYKWRLHVHDPQSYWLTGQDAADLLGITRAHLTQLADAGRLPYLRHGDGTRLYRRDHLVLARNAREARSTA
jgi:excisionase family DNA binding protein